MISIDVLAKKMVSFHIFPNVGVKVDLVDAPRGKSGATSTHSIAPFQPVVGSESSSGIISSGSTIAFFPPLKGETMEHKPSMTGNGKFIESIYDGYGDWEGRFIVLPGNGQFIAHSAIVMTGGLVNDKRTLRTQSANSVEIFPCLLLYTNLVILSLDIYLYVYIYMYNYVYVYMCIIIYIYI